MKPTRLLFAGSFDPFTRGHDSLVRRALLLADSVVVAVGENVGKQGLLPPAERVAAIRQLYAAEPRVSVCSYHGLTAELAREVGATALLRGVRSTKDYELERDMADVNRKLTGVETILLVAEPEYAAISSSIVRELMKFGADVSEFLPKPTDATPAATAGGLDTPSDGTDDGNPATAGAAFVTANATPQTPATASEAHASASEAPASSLEAHAL